MRSGSSHAGIYFYFEHNRVAGGFIPSLLYNNQVYY